MNSLNRFRLSRRALLRGGGVALALPYLEAMAPSSALASPTPAGPARMGIFYFGTGMNMRQFTPPDEGPNFTTTRILEPLEPHRGDFTVLSGVWMEKGGGHGGAYPFCTGFKMEEIAKGEKGSSPDQLVAEQLAGETRFPSMQLSISRGTGYGSQALRTLSWNKQGVPLAAENDPAALFEKLFAEDTGRERKQRQRRFRRRGSILDLVREDAKRMERSLGQSDRRQLEQYFTAIRDVEGQLERNKAWAQQPKPDPDTSGMGDFRRTLTPDKHRDPNFSYERYAKLMYDLIALALQTDSTRVLTYCVRKELAGGVYPEFNVSKGYHSLSHHGNDPQNLEELAKVDTIYSRHWAYFLDRLKSMREGEHTLLDNVMLGYSSGMGIGHSKTRLPTMLAGGRNLGIEHQGHLRLPDQTPLFNLWQTMLDRMGVAVSNEFKDRTLSTGPIKQLIRS